MQAFGGALYAAMRALGGEGGLGVDVINGMPVQFAVSNSRHNVASIGGGLGQLGGGFGFAGLVGSACPLLWGCFNAATKWSLYRHNIRKSSR